jgi:cell division protein FtsB
VLRQPLHDRRARPWQSPVLLLCLGVTAYFAYHAINGRHGLEARTKLIERSAILEFEIKSLEAVRAKLERDVALLAPDLPNPDLVEEIARDVLGFAYPSDRLVAVPHEDAPSAGTTQAPASKP